jgi:NYN domain
MRSCPSCGSAAPEHARFCGNCGRPLCLPLLQEPHEASETLILKGLPRTLWQETRKKTENGGVQVEQKTAPEQVAVVLPFYKDSTSDEQNGFYSSAIQTAKPPQIAHTFSEQNGPSSPNTLPTEERVKEMLTEHRLPMLNDLLALIPFVDEARSAKNQAQFERNVQTLPPIEDDSWGHIAFITGIYGRYMWKHPLSPQQKQGMWQALLWAVRYEQFFRPKMVNDRCGELLNFLNGSAHDNSFLTYALEDLYHLINDLNVITLKKLHERLSKVMLVPQEIVQQLQADLQERITTTPLLSVPLHSAPQTETTEALELDQVLQAIEQLWPLLDKKTESRNHAIFQQAHQAPQEPQATQNLAILASFISRNALYRYTHESTLPGSTLSDRQLQQIILLSHFAATHSTDSAAPYCYALFTALQHMHHHSLDSSSLINELKAQLVDKMFAKTEAEIWSDFLGLVTRHLAEQRKIGMLDTAEAETWIQVAADLPHIDKVVQERFLTEVRLRRICDSLALQKIQNSIVQQPEGSKISFPLAFLGEERSKEFLESIREARLAQVGAILQQARQPLLSSLSQVLSLSTFNELLPPRRSLHIRSKSGVDLFPTAKSQILSDNQADWRLALPIFEQGERETTRRDYKSLAREWSLFAQARVYGPIKVVGRWEEDRSKGVASWEEIWNLAVFYVKIKQLAKALEVLTPGVEAQRAPFIQLRFTLYCGAQLLEHAHEEKPQAVEMAVRFLIAHLTTLPLPECYLAWQLFVKEQLVDIDLIEQLHILSTFQAMIDRPIKLVSPEEVQSDVVIEAFEKELREHNLKATWRIWINDYAERHPYNRRAWQSLSETSERDGALEQAERALQHIARMQLEQYQRGIHKGTQPPEIRYLRTSLTKLFEFYRRNNLPANSNATFNMYYKAQPKLWDSQIPGNKLLIDLTRPHMEGTQVAKSSHLPGDTAKTWLTLQSELGSVHDLSSLKELQQRLCSAIALLTSNQKNVQDGQTAIKNLLNEMCTLDTMIWQHSKLLHEVERLNRAIQQAQFLVKQEPTLAPLKALVAAIQRVFETFCQAQQLAPHVLVHATPLGAGLPLDQTETALVVHLINPGPSTVNNVRVTCSSQGHIISRKEGTLHSLAEQSTGIVALPVTTQPTQEYEPVTFQVHLTYQWGVMQDITSTQTLTTQWYSFHDFLQQHRVPDYEIPIPYVFDTAIDFSKHDPHLFQGRENELQLIRNVFLKRQMSGTPIYFHGIRKVGKTSLLHRICLELRKGNYFPAVVDLHGIKASQQTEPVIVNTFTTRILESTASQGLDVSGLKPVPVEQKNPVVGIESFFKMLRQRAGQKQLVLLLDEFHVIVAEHTTALLDLLRCIHQHDHILFIMSGWLYPELMRRACPETQLFPLVGHTLDYLPLAAIRQVLRAPVVDYGITIPDETVSQVYLQTAGNPYHVAKLASYGIARLNTEHRTVLAPQDVDEIAATLAKDPANFTSSSFSPLIFTPEEQSATIRFARELNGQHETLSIDEATQLFGQDIIQGLEEKYVLEREDHRLGIRSQMLKVYLQARTMEPLPPSSQVLVRRRVGIFVDYENLLPLIPDGMTAREVGKRLERYASHFGNLVCRWACADPRNIPDAIGMCLGLEQEGFQVRYPRGESYDRQVTKNVTDFALLECINDERTHSEPDTYILVSGDRDYYEKIAGLLDHGYVVRLAASLSDGHLASKYKRLQEQRTQVRHAEGYTASDFFIDDLDEILGNTTTIAFRDCAGTDHAD